MTMERVHYRERQTLQAADLVDEQSERIAARRRHNALGHGPGIVMGLSLSTNPLQLEPGMAVDGYGRELMITRPVAIPSSAFDDLGVASADVWLLYGLQSSGDCKTEQAVLRITRASSASTSPANVGIDTPDDSHKEWPVYLGTLTKRPDATIEAVVDTRRRYVGLAGSSVTASSGTAHVQLESETSDDPARFSISVGDATDLTTALTLSRTGKAHVASNATLGGPVRIHGTSPSRTAIGFGDVPEPKVAAPWSIYRTTVVRDSQPISQLRIELAPPLEGEDPASYRFVIGRTDGQGSHFEPAFIVTSHGDVLITNDLHVDGGIGVGPIPADPKDPRFQAAMRQSWLQGLLNSGPNSRPNQVITVGLTVGQTSIEPGGPLSIIAKLANISNDFSVQGGQAKATITYGDEPVDLDAHPSELTYNLTPTRSKTFHLDCTVPNDVGNQDVDIDVTIDGVSGNTPEFAVGSMKVSVALQNHMTIALENLPSSAFAGTPLAYTIKVDNSGPVDLKTPTATVTIDFSPRPTTSIGSVTFPVTTTVSLDTPLNKNSGVRSPAQSFPIPAGLDGDLSISVTVDAFGPGSTTPAHLTTPPTVHTVHIDPPIAP